MSSRKPCPVGCGRTVAPGKLLCLPCWREVPTHLQKDVYRTFRAWWADTGNASKFQAYNEASEAAMASIK